MKFIAILCLNLGVLAFGFSLEELAAQISGRDVSGNFTQTKQIAGFSSRIKSSGEFAITNESLLWQTREPIESAVRIDSSGIYERDASGKWLKSRHAQMDKRLLMAVFRMDFDALSRDFDFALTGDARAWRLSMKPRGAVLGKIFRQIDVMGDSAVRGFDLSEASGDFSEIRFDVR